jgi:hypothetical protein
MIPRLSETVYKEYDKNNEQASKIYNSFFFLPTTTSGAIPKSMIAL